MGKSDKIEHKAEELKGAGKEKAGKARGDESQQAEGQKDQSKANLKQAGEKAKDAFKS